MYSQSTIYFNCGSCVCFLCVFCVFLQKEFVRLIQSSGVLVVLSQAWIEELYNQVLERNLLGEAGYCGAPEDHALPLITVLTGAHAAMFTSG